MGNIFTASEIVALGIQIEKNGRDFYNTLSKKSASQKAKVIFEYLAGEEEKHIVIFEKILEKTDKYEPSETYEGEYLAYMEALAGGSVFIQGENKGTDLAKKTKTDKEAVDLGIGAEKDSIIFYEGMKKVVPEHDHKIIEELILQEQDHLRRLSDLKKDL